MKKNVVLVLMLFFLTINAKNTTQKINENNNHIDTRLLLKPKLDYNEKRLLDIFRVLCYVESDSGIHVYNKEEEAVGIIQIRPIMVKEVNQILGENRFKMDDRWDSEKSFEMFKIYQDFVNPGYDEVLACRYWNGGRSGNKKRATDVYVAKYFKVKKKLNK